MLLDEIYTVIGIIALIVIVASAIWFWGSTKNG